MKTIRWGILGTGQILEKTVGGFRLLSNSARPDRGVELAAIASRDPSRARAAADRWGIPRSHGSYEALVRDPAIDVVLNALHNGLHCEWTVRALEAGKHVLCEKPLACSSAEVDRMFGAARANGRWLMEGFMYRFHPQIAEAHRRIAAGAIGRVVRIECRYLSRGRERGNLRYRREAGGGSLMDLGCYGVNFCRVFAGGEPVRVGAQAHFDDETGVDLTFHGTMTFEAVAAGGRDSVEPIFADFSCSFEAEGSFGAEIFGTEGELRIPHPWRPPDWPAELVWVRGGASEVVRIEASSGPRHPLAPFALEIEHFADCIREQRRPSFPPGGDAEWDSRANLRVIEALQAAARTGRPVELNR